jgi:hypothetical protein
MNEFNEDIKKLEEETFIRHEDELVSNIRRFIGSIWDLNKQNNSCQAKGESWDDKFAQNRVDSCKTIKLFGGTQGSAPHSIVGETVVQSIRQWSQQESP